MPTLLKLLITLLIVLGVPISVSLISDTPPTAPHETLTASTSTKQIETITNLPPDHYLVTKVIDGDTIAIDMNGARTTVRLIGIDTPETVHPTKPVACFGNEASAEALRLMQDRVVRLETDSTQGTSDRYGRRLAYVFLEDATNVNEHLLRSGYAYEYTYGDDYAYKATFKEAMQDAKTHKRGLWGDGVCEGE